LRQGPEEQRPVGEPADGSKLAQAVNGARKRRAIARRDASNAPAGGRARGGGDKEQRSKGEWMGRRGAEAQRWEGGKGRKGLEGSPRTGRSSRKRWNGARKRRGMEGSDARTPSTAEAQAAPRLSFGRRLRTLRIRTPSYASSTGPPRQPLLLWTLPELCFSASLWPINPLCSSAPPPLPRRAHSTAGAFNARRLYFPKGSVLVFPWDQPR